MPKSHLSYLVYRPVFLILCCHTLQLALAQTSVVTSVSVTPNEPEFLEILVNIVLKWLENILQSFYETIKATGRYTK